MRTVLLVLSLTVGAWARAAFAEETHRGTLLYSRLTDGTWQIWQTALATQTQTQLTTSPGDKRAPGWAAEGRITYHTSNQACYLVQPGNPHEAPLLADLWPVRDLSWSPDGAHLAFSKIRTDLIDSANLWVTDAAGRQRRLLTHEAGIQYNSAWSPSGARLAYIGGHGYGTYELYVVDADGMNQQQLTRNQWHEFLPAWSPDGTQLAYTADAGGDYNIWVINADGQNARQLTHSPGLDTHPAWSPDGQRIAFTTNRSGTLEIWVMNADGSDQRRLEHADGGACDPTWR